MGGCRNRPISVMLPEGVTVEKLSIGVDLMAQISNPSKRRGPSLLDACVFIAAIALGLAVVRSDEIGRVRTYWDPLSTGFKGAFRLRFSLVVTYATPFLFFFSVAIVALASRSHQGDRKEAIFRPRVAACFIIIVSTILYVIVNPARKLFYGTLYGYEEVSQSLNGLFVQRLLDMASRAGYLVAALWVLQVAAGGDTGRSSWIDRLGQAIGVIWLVFLFSPPLKPAF
jgi:hypothetical protein